VVYEAVIRAVHPAGHTFFIAPAQIVILITALITLVGTCITALIGRQNKSTIQQIHVMVDGRMDTIVEQVKDLRSERDKLAQLTAAELELEREKSNEPGT
jgi:hypothetical protein